MWMTTASSWNALLFQLAFMLSRGRSGNAFSIISRQVLYHPICRTYSSTSVILQAKGGKKGQQVERVGGTADAYFWEAKMEPNVWRPTMDDVERISWGKPAKKKGTGSRGIPHRLNQEERFQFDTARRKGYLEVDGSGWRSQRREAPLLNTYRSLCDARGQVSIVLHKGNTGIDDLVVDLSPLRNPSTFDRVAQVCLEEVQGSGIAIQGSSTMMEDEPPQVEEEDTVTESLPITLNAADDLSTENINTASLDNEGKEKATTPWELRPIYQLPPYYVSWELSRGDAKVIAKTLATLFDTKEDKPVGSSSRKPIGVKPGKGRQHGGYGIG
jgi:hypothetical protein